MKSLETKQIRFKQGSFVLNDINVTFPEGEMTAIVGPNGSGKSTLLKILAKLHYADKGQVLLDQLSITTYKRKMYAKNVAMLLQVKEPLPNLTVHELVAYGRSPYQGYRPEKTDDLSIIKWALEETGLTKLEDRLFHTLSGGEQQRARIAMALAQKTDILLLDEPTTYLDIAHQLELMELLVRINTTHKITIIMVLHEIQYAAAYCGHIIAMKEGEVVRVGSPKNVIDEKFFRDIYHIHAKIRFEDNYPIIVPLSKIE
ncbi:ABC transporter ATP-binding protein [Paraliobacillus sediminis]|uniref:ABC transporter ATP-binding protein n=1 Tax=Paraliobacillus sediminis TaxID=1885916 RepID=UPI000E3C0FE2|nr:ABC transporter ATP-binding protein [Paraliobacillus sediminis]